MNLVILKSYETSHEANLLRSKISSMGIRCELKDEKTVDVDPIISQAIGGVKVMVPQNELLDALKIMDSIEGMHIKNNKGEVVFCSNCKSKQVILINNFKKGVLGIWQKLVETIKSLNPNYTTNFYQCRICNNQFHFLFVEYSNKKKKNNVSET